MSIHFHFEIIFDEKFLLFKSVIHLRFVFVHQKFKTFDSLVNSLFTFRINNLQKILLKQSLLRPLLHQNYISDDERIVLGFHPYVLVEFAAPNKVRIF